VIGKKGHTNIRSAKGHGTKEEITIQGQNSRALRGQGINRPEHGPSIAQNREDRIKKKCVRTLGAEATKIRGQGN